MKWPVRAAALDEVIAEVIAEVMLDDMAELEGLDEPADFISFAPHAVRVRANTAAAVATIGLMTMWNSFERRGVPITPSPMKLGSAPGAFDKHFRTVRTGPSRRRLSRLSTMRGAMWMRP